MTQCPDPLANRADSTQEMIAEIERLREALNSSIIALDDWIRITAPEHCGEKYVLETKDRIGKGGGTLAYLADIQAANREALSS